MILLITLSSIGFVLNGVPDVVTSQVKKYQDSQLVIYTYDSLFADPRYDLEGNFSSITGIPKEQIQIIRFSDANQIVTRMLIEKDLPQADVVIGIDNALIHLINDKSEVLVPYMPENLSQINTNLIQNLDPELYLIPYDYGIISLWFNNQIINSMTHAELSNLTLDSLLTSELLSKLLVQNPKFSSPGLGFLLWTIAVYGDPQIQFDGLLQKDWRDWWTTARNQLTITKSWGDAFEIFFNTEEDKPFMVSYGTSPAYGFCQWDDDSTTAVVTHENNQPNAWLQIEGIGLIKNAPHEENAKRFIDWFLSKDLQSVLAEHQWVYPANTEAHIPECFNQSSIAPDEVEPLNNLITPSMLKQYLVQWQDDWESAVVITTIPGYNTSVVLITVFFLAISILLRRFER